MNVPELPISPALPSPVPELSPAVPARPWGFWSTFGFGLLAMVVMILAQGAVAAIFGVVMAVRYQIAHGHAMAPQEISNSLVSNPLMLSLSVLISVPIVWLTIWGIVAFRRGPALADYLGIRGFRFTQFLLWTAALAVVVVGGNWVITAMGDRSGAQFVIDLLAKGQSVVLLVAALTIGAPLVEEALFRGFMYRGMAGTRWGAFGAIVLPNCLWVLLHVQYRWPTLLVLFGMGLVLGLARHFSRSTVLPFTMHLLSNSVSVCGALAMVQQGTPTP
jgi:membrane protease YdiL (CAAX protease family)